MKKILFALTLVLATISCTDNIEEYNIDPKNPESVDGDYLFSYGQYRLVWQFCDANYNNNVGRFWANYATQTTYINESNYDASNRDVGGNIWYNIYSTSLYELQSAYELIEAEEASSAEEPIKNNKLAVISILKVFAYQYLVDNFGDIPYTEALDIDNITPAYDDDLYVYEQIIQELENAISLIDTSEDSFGTSDLIYSGDMTLWKKFAHSLQLKLGTRISNYDTTTASELIQAAVSGGVFTSNDDMPLLTWSGTQPYINPLYDYFYVDARASDFVATENFLELLESYSDPRLAVFYDDNIDSGYVGGVYGASGNAYSELTHFNPDWTENSIRPSAIMEYATVCFELAEAVERGYISGSASDYYSAGITASFEYLGLTATEATAYIALNPYDSANWDESIGMQKYIALFHNGHEAWTEARRTGIPELAVAESSGTENPNRMIYPLDESKINGTNYDEASSNMGGDEASSTIFWDVN
ncbi:SusD/RagB family nutrient-binding outer membrane lipoprotein [Maribacter polysaccharolyticus]|uniref:SusD/RagB family nutrient-binding outer membrane lipoprotein n=1 Tax=Maribacter polysaccharolyticus TaxID=3020831 RepID=UPI00237F6B4C|nr:SusD/RagB family nutrient-binding outer membrane lipoprotein [Maribacter polysaccharolyticus]MDE3741561.1 SusD/RagB family nutrient-binding outer membrane lipoprotein [Maribacter polysaccharolyticus]